MEGAEDILENLSISDEAITEMLTEQDRAESTPIAQNAHMSENTPGASTDAPNAQFCTLDADISLDWTT